MDYFIDSNIIIDLLNSKLDNKYKEILKNEDNTFFINRLVLVESLRTIPLKNSNIYKQAKNTLKAFSQVDITAKIYDEAIELSRLCIKQGISLKGKCEAIDFIHFITTKEYNLEPLSKDGDFSKLDGVYKK